MYEMFLCVGLSWWVSGCNMEMKTKYESMDDCIRVLEVNLKNNKDSSGTCYMIENPLEHQKGVNDG